MTSDDPGKTGKPSRWRKASKLVRAWMGAGFFVCIVLIIVFNTMLLSPDKRLWSLYPLTAGLMIAAIVAIGVTLNGRPAGLFIDNRNRVSLSKFQMLLWTVVVVSALTVFAAYNVRNGLTPPATVQNGVAAVTGPLEIAIPPELLFAMGIAATSFVAAPTVLSLKAQEDPSSTDVSQARAGGELNANGKVHGRKDPAQAQWADMFRGDEVGNYDSPDLSKIQQFAITLVLAGIYSSQIIARCLEIKVGTDAFTTLPVLGAQFVTLMGISHASYLVYKAAPHTTSADPDAPAPSSDGAAKVDTAS